MKTLNQIQDWKEMINEVILDDCFNGMKLISDNSIDCIITDPPYGTTALEWDNELNFDKFWEEIKRVRKKDAHQEAIQYLSKFLQKEPPIDTTFIDNLIKNAN